MSEIYFSRLGVSHDDNSCGDQCRESKGAAALAVPRYPLLKEWAYAGMFIDFSSAIVAYASVGDGVVSYIGPVLSKSALLASWSLRPQSRRLAGTYLRRTGGPRAVLDVD